MTRIADLHPCERPRERLAARGAAALGDDELLALALRTGNAGRGALDLARDLLAAHPDGGLGRLGYARLAELEGLGTGRAAALAASFELARRWRTPEERALPRVDSPARVWERLEPLRTERKEHFVGLYLDACNGLLHQETVSIGTLTASLVHPREVFVPAVERSAAGVIVAHNHPSGDLRPSQEDRETTRRLASAGRILGIPLLDHVLVTSGGWLSFREQGLLGSPA